MRKGIIVFGATLLVVGTISLIALTQNTYNSNVSSYSTFLAQQKENQLGEVEFQKFVARFKKDYKNVNQMVQRFANFQENKRFIDAHNAEEKDFKLALNQFADLTDKEYQSRLKFKGSLAADISTLNFPEIQKLKSKKPTNATKTNFDWTTQGKVTPIKDQGDCGSCYSFASVATIESALIIFKNESQSIDLSEQQIVDCAKDDVNNGCDGGNMVNVFEYFKTHKIQTEASYPYTALDLGTCKYNASNGVTLVSDYVAFSTKDPETIIAAVNKQPVSIGISAGKKAFQYYSSGILSKKCGTRLDHAVVIVGYGTDATSKKDYWIIKNQYGSSWGMNGYARILRSKGTYYGVCGINAETVYPILPS